MTRTRTIVSMAVVLCGAAILAVSYFTSEASYSNIYPGDYVGPATCGKCHEDNFALWQNHGHRRMNQTANDETVRGDFSGQRIDYGRGYAIFERGGDDFLMSIYEQDRLLRRHVVTRTVGSLYMQYYIGKQVYGPEPPDDPTYKQESKLPFGYSFALKRWLPEIYLDSTVASEREFLMGRYPDYIYGQPPNHSWNMSCMTCHNTYPYVARLWKQEHDDGFPRRTGFPADHIEWRGQPFHQGAFRQGEHVRGLAVDELVTVGVSCESCHFGGREHATEGREIRFIPTAPELTIHDPRSGGIAVSDRKDPFVVNSICNQCHCAELNTYANASPAVNSNEAGELMGGACSSQIKCTDCHNPHQRGQPSGSPVQKKHIQACVKCHQNFADSTTAAAHSRHSNGVTCLDCHMPRIIAGLDTVTRSHRITVPVEREMVAQGQLNACNLCHLDRPILWTLAELEKGWGSEVPSRAQVAEWYGPTLDNPLGATWLDHPDSFVRMVAVEAYARSPLVRDPFPFLLRSLTDEYAFNRTFGLITVQRHLGREIPREDYDLLAGPLLWKTQVEKLAEAHRAGLARADTTERSAPRGPVSAAVQSASFE